MTKAEEMQRYDEFLRKLPQDSYLRPWLTSIRDHVETAIRCDIFPEFTPQETFHQCQQSRKDAANYIRQSLDRKRSDAARILADAEAKATAITKRAEADAEDIRREIRSEVHALRHALSAVA